MALDGMVITLSFIPMDSIINRLKGALLYRGMLPQLCLVLWLSSVFAASGADNKTFEGWFRALNLSAPVNPRFEPLEISGVGTHTGEHIYGTFRYRYRPTADVHSDAILLKGARDIEGTFWPHVVAQVANDLQSSWQIIGNPTIPTAVAVLKVVPESKSETLYVNLDIFRPMIGKMKLGKVVLETGESAIFALDDLLPPK